MSRNLGNEAELFHDHGLHLPTRTISFTGDADEGLTNDNVERLIKNLHILDTMREGDITIKFNCDGGDTVLGMAIYDAIKCCKNFVRIVVYGHASSMGSIILQAADERIMSPNSVLMIHAGKVQYSADHPKIIDNWRSYDKKMDVIHEDIYLKRIKEKKARFTKEKLQKLLEHDTIFTAKEAVNYGLADKILEE